VRGEGRSVGWVERSETHHGQYSCWTAHDGFRCALPILRPGDDHAITWQVLPKSLAIGGLDGVTGGIATNIGIAVASPSSRDGLSIARERIAKEAEEKTGFLDIGKLGLVELPEELFRLKHLRGLNLGSGYFDPLREWEPGIPEIEKNTIGNDLGRLTELTELQLLSLCDTVLSDLSGLAGVANLVEIDCAATQVSDLAPVAGLSKLQTLDCHRTHVSDLAPVAGLPNLRTLGCYITRVNDLAAVAGLSDLQMLDCSNTPVSDLAPVVGLTSLHTLACSNTEVSDLAPVAGLTDLRVLECSNTQVSDLAPLAGLINLRTLDCSGCRLAAFSPSFWQNIPKMRLFLYQTIIPHVPQEVLSRGRHDDCFDSLRAHLNEIAAEREGS
jgi:hypothetical protein